MIMLEQICKTYKIGRERKIHALHNISETVYEGEFVAVVGPSGSGKSTFLAMAGLLERPTEGVVRFDGKDVTNLRDKERTRIRAERCGFIFQFPSLIPTLNTLENVLLPKTIHRTYQASDEKWGKEVLEKVGLKDKLENLPYQLSGGEQRRVALARALINKPDVILADEPTGAVDAYNASVIVSLFKEWNAQGKTVIMVTHDMKQADEAGRIIELADGRLKQDME
ncbi:ABC transporter ATP-binding protein [Aneurinibacillus aneurinilyticus]|jgi:ABC-type lipoprotein export system ATPase subunit|uniref:ABC transporter ATP-binding protein n=2 Tax=Aneurinibacillus aneurinilyticus TaxID=1391 RepID=A0A848CT92_ANEAE|nr:ABC transporter ATP-binding protein [Aneurinibacillus aneurinilyticus]ERI11289.1 ABC transporter, ATP-binding protein [Aneurinibacillus aneurinilyticus ATCC 12856]MCI1693850.1 ABC transporter ATP-binding protein [Aneurinibacillus aneurinilyticus]MED0671977.1 ABC transporter ATP-binding protein [Aneurinibacillus aneurinilyticus]MED0706618.1 ABC transporter ATP-binding protein [Aneurinibacillus aneurinilyticus]MED0724537.1 ABC transporter ATP-binding protein [Aneurinibacillus aneurinilyticus]